MFLRTITIKGVTRLYFYESYYKNGKTKQKCLENLGRLDELQKQFADPVSHFKRVAEERTIEKKTSMKTSVTIDPASSMDIKEDNLKNVGYVVLKELYKQLELDKFWKNILKKLPLNMTLKQFSAFWSFHVSFIPVPRWIPSIKKIFTSKNLRDSP